MHKEKLLNGIIILSVLISTAFCIGEIPDNPTGGSPEPVSTALIGSALVTIFYKTKRS